MGEITLDDIDNSETQAKNIRVALQGIGRELYQMREGEKLGEQYGFTRYQRTNYCGEHYDGQEGPDWGVGTPIFSLRYWWERACNEICVTFPQGWLEQDWRALERERLEAERARTAALEKAVQEQAAREQEEGERQEFERLKAKFEPEEPKP